MNNNWYLRSRRRFFLDNHIDSWNDEFLSKYNPDTYAECCKSGNATAATYMANTHTGLLNWPSKCGGTMHPAWKGRDMLQETIDALHRRNIDAIIYYVFVYVADYWNEHPESRTVLQNGRNSMVRVGTDNGPARFATCCINDPGYRKRALSELAELCENYDFEGIWPDMTFWPGVCYCDNCRRRYRAETGRELPEIIDWKSEEFVSFVRTRQRWLAEFAQEVTDTIKTRKPGMKLAQQSQTFTWDWMAGGSAELADCWDWMSADLYCDHYGLSYSSKLFYSLSSVKPFERVNCWNVPNIHEHVITKTQDELRQVAFSTIMNDGALTVIDQIDPIGTVHTRNYKTMGRVFSEIEKYEPYLGGEFRQDVGIYYSFNSNFDSSWNGRPVGDAGFTFEYGKDNPAYQNNNAHLKCAANAAKTLTYFHVPYGIITKKNLRDLNNYQVLILPNVMMLDEEECSAIRNYVKDGGSLYASKETGTISADGKVNGVFLLEDVFGVSLQGTLGERITYVSPTVQGKSIFPDVFSADFPVTVRDCQTDVSCVDPEAVILGNVTLPYSYPNEQRHASMLTTPPGRYTEHPALIEHIYGKGKVVYSAALLEMGEHISQREIFYRIIRKISKTYTTELEGYPQIEITRFDQKEKNQTMLHILNYQAELPNIPVRDLKFRMNTEGRCVMKAFLVPEGNPVECDADKDSLEIHLPFIQDYALICIQYE